MIIQCYLYFFFNVASMASFLLIFDCLEITILQHINMKNGHLVYYAGI